MRRGLWIALVLALAACERVIDITPDLPGADAGSPPADASVDGGLVDGGTDGGLPDAI